MNNNRPFPSAFQNMNRNRNYNRERDRPAPSGPAPVPRPKTPDLLEMNETNFPSLGGSVVPAQMRVFDTSFAKRVEQTKQIEEYQRLKEERLREEREKAGQFKPYVVQRTTTSSNRYNDYDDDYDDYVYRQEENQPLSEIEEEDEGWTTVSNTRAFKPKQTLSTEQLAVKYNQIEVLDDEPDLHTTEDHQDMIEYGYRHTHG